MFLGVFRRRFFALVGAGALAISVPNEDGGDHSTCLERCKLVLVSGSPHVRKAGSKKSCLNALACLQLLIVGLSQARSHCALDSIWYVLDALGELWHN